MRRPEDAPLLFGARLLCLKVERPIFRWLWFRMKRDRPVEGVSIDEARAIKQRVGIPVISTGGYQRASYIREIIGNGSCDAVSMARALVANNDLVQRFAAGQEQPEKPCTFCNKCLLNAPKNPLGCYELDRYGGDRDKMLAEILSIYETPPIYQVPGTNAKPKPAVRKKAAKKSTAKRATRKKAAPKAVETVQSDEQA